MIVLGMTSYGNKNGIDWRLNQSGRRIPIFPIYKNEIESYQAWAVFEVMQLEQNTIGLSTEQGKWLEIGFKFYKQQLTSESNRIDDIETHLGIVNAFQRARYARIFIRSEFQKNSG